jgi:TonB family protein
MNRLIPLVSFLLSACASTGVELPDQELKGPKPDFPVSEARHGREGWVVIGYSVSDDGGISGLTVLDSSGSDTFDAAALRALEQWRFEPAANEYDSSILVKFVFERSSPRVTKDFRRRYLGAKNLIDAGQLDEASQRLVEMMARDLYPTELAYVWLARARIADLRGDKEVQLDCFRKAMISNGRWVDRQLYLELLRATTILGLETNDYASAVRDYDELMDSPVGREMAADLEPAVEAARTITGDDKPFEPALSQLVVKRLGRVGGAPNWGPRDQSKYDMRSGWDTPRQPPPTPTPAPPTQSRL